MKSKITLVLLFSLNSILSFSQDKRAQNFFVRGQDAFLHKDYSQANLFLNKAIERYPEYGMAYYLMGQMSYASRDLVSAKKYYQKLIELEPENPTYVLAYTFLGNDFLKQNKYAEAKAFLEKALTKIRGGTPNYRQIERQIKNCSFALEILKNPLDIEPSEMPAVLNFKDKQYFPVFTADGQSIYFTARNNGQASDEDIFISQLEAGKWTYPKSLSENINTNYNEGTCTISADGKTMVFTSCEGREGLGGCDLFISKLTDLGWSIPENMGEKVNSPNWDSQASLSSDGRMLVFCSDRYGGEGEKDLYVSELDEMYEWTKARNLGKVINTPKDEVSPFLHANGTSIFFASRGHSGLGGFDLFMTNREKKSFTRPLNLGYPINDGSDQFALVISADGKQAYFSKELGDKVRLYQFDLPKELMEKFEPTFYLKGHVVDAKTKFPLAARIQLINLSTKDVVSTFTANKGSGEYLAVLPFDGNFGLYIEHENYFFKSLSFSFDSKEKKSNKELPIELERIDKNKIDVLRNIYFDEASWELKPESLVELSKLADFLWKNSSLKVEISGHTDNVGDGQSNLSLSQKRAQSVVQYLINEGLNSGNFTAKGFGEDYPVADNESEEGRSKNRRIEIRYY
ncbi:MAG: outer membrane protein OmpA-like peptidoglycan-associated protein/Tfp pilus assembly protein PilF [Arcticibacterium sp.]|jgi:outer membrane protein OmpA-like peptidoglycan-associated protein/Tfp pilus assembly protein PilF